MHDFRKKNESLINFLLGKYQYKICAPKYCDDKTFDKDVSMDIDVNSLIVINEYIFVQVCILQSFKFVLLRRQLKKHQLLKNYIQFPNFFFSVIFRNLHNSAPLFMYHGRDNHSNQLIFHWT